MLALIALIAACYLKTRKSAQPPLPDPAMPSVAAPIETVNAMFARRPIPKGTLFNRPMLVADLCEQKKNVPLDDLPRARVLSSYNQLEDRIALEDIARGEVLIAARFALPEELGRVISQDEPLR